MAFAVLVIAAVFVFVVWKNQPPLRGESVHNFGRVTMEAGETVELRHVFRLINQTNDAVQVIAARPDCGCVNARQGLPALVLPGEALQLPVTMAFSASSKKVVIYLEIENFPEQKLLVQAEADFLPKVKSSRDRIEVAPGETATQTISVEMFGSTDAPPSPMFKAPEHIRCSFGEWKLIERSPNPQASPSLWEGTVTISADRPVADGEQVMINVERSNSLAVSLAPAKVPADSQPENPPVSTPDDR
jgi:hypothetical protein